MSYNPVSSTAVADAIKVEAAAYSLLYASQGIKHVRYSWLLWVVVAGFLIVTALCRLLKLGHRRMANCIEHFFSRRSIFGLNLGTSRIQFLVLLTYTLYNLILSFADIPYGHKYRYASKHSANYVQTATTLQFIANRTGYLAFASIPLVFLLVSRNSIVSLCSGVSYQALNLLHRWVGWTILVLSWAHTMLWTIEMGIHYHIEGGYLATRWRMRYWLGGFFACLLLTWLVLHSLPMVRRYTGYEFFRNSHNFGSVLFLIGCWVHWPAAFQWIAAALAIYYSDRIFRWTFILVHYVRARGQSGLTGTVYTDEDDVSVAVISIANPGIKSWKAGEHVFIYCISLGEWEPHPFSVANSGVAGHALRLVVRRKAGLTSELVDQLCFEKKPIRVLVDGPYGGIDQDLLKASALLLIVGGTGISLALSALHSMSSLPKQHVRLIWYIRRNANISWVQQDLREIAESMGESLYIEIRVSREFAVSTNQQASMEILEEQKRGFTSANHVPQIKVRHREAGDTIPQEIQSFCDQYCDQSVSILGCGPGTMGSEIEEAAEGVQLKTPMSLRCHVEHYMA